MKKIHVNLQENSYDICIERGLFRQLGVFTKGLTKAETVAIISDNRVDAIYGDTAQRLLHEAGFKVGRIVFPEGEIHKSMETLSRVYEELFNIGITRSDVIITLGGGVTGDLGGMAAATYLRGVPFIQVPTTVLAQIDSSVGGKVAVDLPSGKNLVGSFYQPIGVLIDPDMLATLDIRYIRDGLAEAVKYACIADGELFAKFETWRDVQDILREAEEIIARCCTIKTEIVEEDPYDNGKRMILNFGHTLGHVIEAKYNYAVYTHGEGVSIGMCLLTERTERLGHTISGTTIRLKNVLRQIGLPTEVKEKPSQLLDGVGHDKKRRGNRITLIIIPEIGKSTLVPMPLNQLSEYVPD